MAFLSVSAQEIPDEQNPAKTPLLLFRAEHMNSPFNKTDSGTSDEHGLSDRTVLMSGGWPVGEVVGIFVDGLRFWSYQIYNVFGQLISSGNSNSNLQLIRLDNCAKGVYHVRICSESYVSVKEIVIE